MKGELQGAECILIVAVIVIDSQVSTELQTGEELAKLQKRDRHLKFVRSRVS